MERNALRISTFTRFRSVNFDSNVYSCHANNSLSLSLSLRVFSLPNLFLSYRRCTDFSRPKETIVEQRLRSQEISCSELSGQPPEISSQLPTTRSLSSVTSISARVSRSNIPWRCARLSSIRVYKLANFSFERKLNSEEN